MPRSYKIYIDLIPWVVSPEAALFVVEAERSTSRHVSDRDALRCVQVVTGVLRVLLNRAGWVSFSLHDMLDCCLPA